MHPLGKHKLGHHQRLQERPKSIDSWRLWRKALKLFVHAHNKKLDVPLGKWLLPPDKLKMAWPFYLDPTSGHLFQRTLTNQFKCLQPKAPSKPQNGPPAVTTSTSYPTRGSIVVAQLPASAVPAPVFVTQKRIKDCQGDFDTVPKWKLIVVGPVLEQLQVGPLPKEPETFQEHPEQLKPWESHLLESLVYGTLKLE
jgi:hypothetical protein